MCSNNFPKTEAYRLSKIIIKATILFLQKTSCTRIKFLPLPEYQKSYKYYFGRYTKSSKDSNEHLGTL